MTKPKMALVRYSGLGDVCMALCAAKAASRAGYDVVVNTRPEYWPLVDACNYARGPKAGELFERVFDLGPAYHGIQDMHQVDAYLKTMGLSNVKDEDKCLSLDVRMEIGRSCTKKQVLLHPGISDPNRTWPREHWIALAKLFLGAGCDVQWIGNPSSPDNRSCHTDLNVKDVGGLWSDDLLQTVRAMRMADLLVSCDGGPIQLAGATDIGIIGIYSVVKGENRLPYRRGIKGWNAKAVEPHCQWFPCYSHMFKNGENPPDLGKYFKEWCPFGDANLPDLDVRYNCMRCINPVMVYQAGMELLK